MAGVSEVGYTNAILNKRQNHIDCAMFIIVPSKLPHLWCGDKHSLSLENCFGFQAVWRYTAQFGRKGYAAIAFPANNVILDLLLEVF